MLYVFFFRQKTAYEMRISDWSSDRVLFRSIAEPVRLHAAPRERGQQCRCEHRCADATEQGNERGHAGGRFFCLSIRATPVAPAMNSVARHRLDLLHCGIAGSPSAGRMNFASWTAPRTGAVVDPPSDPRTRPWL